jgi:prepilin-type N-terminal cleavage/methylation domain-containing protein
MKDTGGFTLVELLIVLAIIAVVASIGMAGYRNARVRGNETGAVAALTAINQAQFSYAHICGGGKYAPTLAALGAPMPTSGQAFLSPDLASGESVEKNGYHFTMAGAVVEEAKPTCTGVMPLETYQATADPVTPGFSGLRFFGTNTDRVIYEDAATFLKNMPDTGAPAHGAEVR